MKIKMVAWILCFFMGFLYCECLLSAENGNQEMAKQVVPSLDNKNNDNKDNKDYNKIPNVHSIFTEVFQWKDENNKIIQLANFRGKATVITSAYTECKKTCPLLTMNVLNELQKGFDEKQKPVDFFIISLDPDSDTPEVLAKFKIKRNLQARTNWHFLTADKDQTKKALQLLNQADYWKLDDHIVHQLKILIFNSNNQLEQLLDWEHHNVAEYFKNH